MAISAPPIPRRSKILGAVLVVVPISVALVFLGVTIGSQPVSNGVLAIFLVSMLLGMGGASVFVVVQLFAEGKAFIGKIMEPRGPVSGPVLLAFFILSGGLVSAASQASVGTFVAGNIWTAFLLGFGWQGAVSGIEGSTASRAREAETDVERVKTNAEESSRIKDEARKAELARIASELSKIP